MELLPRGAAALAAAALVACAAAPASQAGISPATVISGSGLDVEDFSVAMNPSGERSAIVLEALARGSRDRQVLLFARLGRGRSLPLAQRLEALRTASGARVSVSEAKVSVGPDGTTVAAWIATTTPRNLQRVRVATAPPGKRFGRPRTLVAVSMRPSLQFAAVLAGRGGLAVVCWRLSEKIEVAVRRGGRFGPRQRIGSTIESEDPTLALTPTGVVIAAWNPLEGAFAATAAVLRAGARRFGRARPVSATGEATDFTRAVSGPGGAGVAWTVTTPPSGGPTRQRSLRLARLRTRAGAFSAPVTLVDVDASGAAHVAMPRLGIATAWRHYSVRSFAGEDDVLEDSRLAATASWLGDLAPRRLSEPPQLAGRPVLAALADRALIAWTELAPGSPASTSMHLAVAGPDGWQPTQTFGEGAGRTPIETTFPEHHAAGELSVAAGREGAVLAWVTLTDLAHGSPLGRLRVAGYRP